MSVGKTPQTSPPSSMRPLAQWPCLLLSETLHSALPSRAMHVSLLVSDRCSCGFFPSSPQIVQIVNALTALWTPVGALIWNWVLVRCIVGMLISRGNRPTAIWSGVERGAFSLITWQTHHHNWNPPRCKHAWPLKGMGDGTLIALLCYAPKTHTNK